MLYIFPDTNVFIHGRYFEEVDWSALTGSPEISIVLAPSVIAELDKHKNNTAKKVAQRVRKLMPRIEAIIQNPDSSKWKIIPILRRLPRDFLDQHHFDPKDQDDALLASILQFNETITTEDQVLLITNDTGPKLKALSLNIPVRSLPDEYMLPDEPDESEKKIATLQKELDQYKNKTPLVTLQFEHGSNFLEVKKTFEIKSKQEYIDSEMEKIRKEYPEMIFRDNDSIMLPTGQRAKIALFRPREEQVDTYNTELKEFFAQYEKFFASQYKQGSFIFNCCKIKLVVTNTGSVPAQDLDIHMHFPMVLRSLRKIVFPSLMKSLHRHISHNTLLICARRFPDLINFRR
ncbi:MAG: hypothetical protein GXC78_13130 [Chitinophagaceae bacterium]|nr:hypothetical protein [Chitinophagaceae bacterium]